jgi:GNAT superfamily N-acetyltransferase
MPGLEHVPASAVVHRVEPGPFTRNPSRWVALAETRLRAAGHRLARVYLRPEGEALGRGLQLEGYRARMEIGFVADVPLGRARPGVRLRPVGTQGDWALKRRIHEDTEHQSDGYDALGAEWVELERRKCATGRMRCFVLEVHGEPCGATAAIEVEEFLRVKNLFIRPRERGRGLALDAVRLLATLAAADGRRAVGCFAVAGTPSEAVYRRAGLRPVTRLVEWTKGIP